MTFKTLNGTKTASVLLVASSLCACAPMNAETIGASTRPGVCRTDQSSAQFREQTAPPSQLLPGEHAMVSVTFDNCSGHTWTTRDYSLRPNAPSDSSTWSVARVALPEDVPNGVEVTIAFEVVAPLESGRYPFTWSILQDGNGPLQQPSEVVNVEVHSTGDCSQAGPPARFISQSAPTAFVAPGDAVHATVTFVNCSRDTWSAANGFALGSQATQDNTTWGTARVALTEDVPPGRQVTLPIDVHAPAALGVYNFAWEIVGTDGQWYGEPSPTVSVSVLAPVDCTQPGPLSRFVTETAPGDAFDPGQSFHASVTFANCSGSTWDTSYHLGAADPANAATWNTGRIALPGSVGHGFAIEIPFDGHAPDSSGSFSYRWAIAQDGQPALDAPSPNHQYDIRDLVNCGALQWWNSYIGYAHVTGPWKDTDLRVHASTPVQLRHRSRLDASGVHAWGWQPVFTDLVTGQVFSFLHLRPQFQWASSVGRVYPAGFIVGLSGGDTTDTGYLVPDGSGSYYSTGAHLCLHTLAAYRVAFPEGVDACR